MTTTVVHSIGTSARDYSTIAAWEAAAPADLTTVDEIWKGECYNDSEFVTTVTTMISGTTTDATRYKWLSAAAGQSFVDNANKLTNALAYNAANGAALRVTNYNFTLVCQENYFLVDRMQLQASSSSRDALLISNTTTAKQCILEGLAGSYYPVSMAGSGACIVENCLVVTRSSTAHGVYYKYPGAGSGVYNCTIVSPSNLSNTGTGVFNNGSVPSGANVTVQNCAIFGFATAISSSINTASDYNATDKATLPSGTHNQTSLTYASQFQNVTDSTRDFRTLSTGGLKHGTPDSTHTGGVDIVGQTRDATTPYIGAWEAASGGGTPSDFFQTTLGIG